MKRKMLSILMGILTLASLSACGTDPEITQFKKEMDEFCEAVADLNESINAIDAEADNAAALALDYLDQLDRQFQNFAEMDFPEEFDYMESLADEAGDYMTEAVKSYHEAFADESYNEAIAEYARGNSARAFKRVQVILDILHGEDPTAGSASEEAGSGAGSTAAVPE